MAELRLYKNDPVLIFFLDKLRLNWRSASVIYTGLWLVDTLLFSTLAGVFNSSQVIMGLRDDLPNAVGMILWSGLVLLMYYAWSGKAFSHMLQQLQERGALQQDLRLKFERLWNHKGWTVAAVVVSVLWMLVIFMPMAYISYYGGKQFWYDVYPLYKFYYLMKLFFWIYVICRIITLEILGVYSLRVLAINQGLRYHPFHSDQAGGLLPVGQYRMGFVYGVAGINVFFIVIVIQPYFRGANPHTLIGPFGAVDLFLLLLIILFVPIYFIFPLWKTHQVMKQARDELVKKATANFNHKYGGLVASGELISRGLSKDFHDDLAAIGLLRSQPDWPVNAATSRHFFGSWLSLFTAPALAIAVDLFAEWLKGRFLSP